MRAGFALPRHVLLFFAITLLEHATPIESERVRGARATGGGLEVRLVPRIPGCEVTAELDERYAVRARQYRYRGAAWRETVQQDVTIEGPGFRLVARALETSPLSAPERETAFQRLP